MKSFLLFLAILFTAFALIIVVENKEVKADTFGANLVGWWTLDSNKISGTTVTDSSSSGNNATNVGSPVAALGRVGQAQTYNGTTQYSTILVNTAVASVPTAIGSIANANSYSFSAWIKTSSATAIGATAPWGVGNPVVEARGTNNFKGAWSFGTESGKLATGRCNVNTCTAARPVSTSSVNDNQWHHVVATININAVSFYIDGKLNSTGTFSDALSIGNCSVGQVGNTNTYMQLGARTTNAAAYATFFNGQLDDVRIFKISLSANDVASLYNLGLGHRHGTF